jgi:carbamoyltransferase
MISLGISALYHDASICLMDNDKVIFASQAERFSRIKNDKNLNTDLFNELLKYDPPEKIIWYERHNLRILRKLLFDRSIKGVTFSVKKYLRNFIDTNIVSVPHHDSHAAACLYTAPYNTENALVFSIDAVGELYSIVVYKVVNNLLKRVEEVYYPHSLGLFYSAFTDMLGLKANEEEYILMGMASYGDPNKYYNFIKESCFLNGTKTLYNFNRGCRGLIDIKEDEKYDIAAAVQQVYEEKLIEFVKKIMHKYASSNIMLSGGCALNCSANSKLLNIVDNIHIFPHPGDGGSSVGACLAFTKQNIDMKHNFWGYNAGGIHSPEYIVNEILTKGYSFVINGRAEFGPRALGNRSILADPRNKKMQDIINNIKGRELFRPFAPCILKEHFNEYFDTCGLPESPYMQYTLKCKKPQDIPAVVHVDGTSRVQTVDKNNIFLYKILKIWKEKTNIPVLLNTSLNKKGKPLINSYNDMKEFNFYD